MAYGPTGGMQDIFRMQQGAPQMQSQAQSFINPMAAALRNPQFNGDMSTMSGAVPPSGGGPNPFMALLQNMKGGGGMGGGGREPAMLGGGMGPMGQMGGVNPMMGQMGGMGPMQGGAAMNNPYNQMMDDNFWTYLLRQMFPQKK